jgi:metal-sulfur cluster biosynthetic enzyme
MVQAVYDEVVVEGEEFAYVQLTPDAYACGMALALPEEVHMVLARPTGVGHAPTTMMPIEGRDEWLAAATARSA